MIQESEQRRVISPELSFEENRLRFARAAIDKGIHLIRPGRSSIKKLERQNDIFARRLAGEGFKTIGADYERDAKWAETQFDQGIARLLANSPEELRREFPKESLFMTRSEKIKKVSRERQAALECGLADPTLNKIQLQKIKKKFGPKVYERNIDLLIPLERVYKRVFHIWPSQDELSWAAEQLERDGGVVVFSFRERQEKEVVIRYFVLRYDYDDSVYTLEDSSKTQYLPRLPYEKE